MAQKTIGELETKASILSTDKMVVDDGVNSYNMTVGQLATAVLPVQTDNNFKCLQTNGSTTFWGALNPGALCSTDSGTAAKTIDLTNFVLSDFCRITVKFSNANTASSPTLNVNGTGAKPIKINGLTSITDITWEAGTMTDFIYDGENWVCDLKRQNPDYANGVNKSTSGFTADADGWVYVSANGGDNQYASIVINSVYFNIFYVVGAMLTATNFHKVSKGDVITIDKSGGATISGMKFYPVKPQI